MASRYISRTGGLTLPDRLGLEKKGFAAPGVNFVSTPSRSRTSSQFTNTFRCRRTVLTLVEYWRI